MTTEILPKWFNENEYKLLPSGSLGGKYTKY